MYRMYSSHLVILSLESSIIQIEVTDYSSGINLPPETIGQILRTVSCMFDHVRKQRGILDNPSKRFIRPGMFRIRVEPLRQWSLV